MSGKSNYVVSGEGLNPLLNINEPVSLDVQEVEDVSADQEGRGRDSRLAAELVEKLPEFRKVYHSLLLDIELENG